MRFFPKGQRAKILGKKSPISFRLVVDGGFATSKIEHHVSQSPSLASDDSIKQVFTPHWKLMTVAGVEM
jgi:hypothetical protein